MNPVTRSETSRRECRIVLQQASGQRRRNVFEQDRPLLGRSFEQLLCSKVDVLRDSVWIPRHVFSQFTEICIEPDAYAFSYLWRSKRQLRYELNLIELAPEHGELEIAGVRVTPFPVNHFGSDVGAPPLALRLQIDGQVLAYTGDTDWVASLVPCGRGADLLIAEAWHYRSNYRFHLDFVTLQQHLGQIGAKRVMVTHMNQDMIDRAKSDSLGIEAAEDGKVVKSRSSPQAGEET